MREFFKYAVMALTVFYGIATLYADPPTDQRKSKIKRVVAITMILAAIFTLINDFLSEAEKKDQELFSKDIAFKKETRVRDSLDSIAYLRYINLQSASKKNLLLISNVKDSIRFQSFMNQLFHNQNIRNLRVIRDSLRYVVDSVKGIGGSLSMINRYVDEVHNLLIPCYVEIQIEFELKDSVKLLIFNQLKSNKLFETNHIIDSMEKSWTRIYSQENNINFLGPLVNLLIIKGSWHVCFRDFPLYKRTIYTSLISKNANSEDIFVNKKTVLVNLRYNVNEFQGIINSSNELTGKEVMINFEVINKNLNAILTNSISFRYINFNFESNPKKLLILTKFNKIVEGYYGADIVEDRLMIFSSKVEGRNVILNDKFKL